MRFNLYDKVIIKDLPHLAPYWRGKKGEVCSIQYLIPFEFYKKYYKQSEPFSYEVEFDMGIFYFLGTDLELV